MSGYGTVNSNAAESGAPRGSAGEETGLLPRKDEAQPFSKRITSHLINNVDNHRGDWILLFCYVVTGLLDSSATAIWGSFVSMQTGNTVYLGLGIVNPQESRRWIKSGISIVGFCFGSFCFSRFHRAFGPRRRWVLATSFLVQVLLIVLAAVIVMTTPRKYSKGTGMPKWYDLVPLALVAFQSSGQAVASRALQFGALTSVVLTSIYCDLFSDQNLFVSPMHNVDRNRRSAAPVLLLLGAMMGGAWAQSAVGLAGALWTAAIMKAFIVVAWLLWNTEPDESDE